MARGSAPGERRGGRKVGTPNKASTRILREAIVNAAEAVGSDGKGKDGLEGYLQAVAVKDYKAYCGLIGRVVPLQVEGQGKDGAIILQISQTDAGIG